jgi:flavin reductase (DIM6/NTAB) family NADH-FMN oxidoreductase RutF
MKKQLGPGFRPVYPTPAAMITSIDRSGAPNIITLGEVFNISLSKPPIVGLAIRKATYSHGLIADRRECVVNLPTRRILEETDFCGTHTGRNIDKFAAAGLTAAPALRVAPPLIAECPINIECRVSGIQEIGDHDLFVCEVVETHIDEEMLGDDGKIDYSRLDAFCFLFNLSQKGEYWSIGEKIADAWSTRKRAR